ncbi:MAG TPA: c-type cytochrome [Casimicrobiaceae bacterium]
MKRLVRWTGVALGSMVALCIVAYIVVYFLSERVLQRRYDIPAVSLSIPTDAASISEGERLATIRGCFHGCHGKQTEGAVLFDEPVIARLVAPNLTAATRKYSDAQLAVIIRNGVRPGGQGMLVMPSEAFVGLTDEDLGRIIAFLKSQPAVAGPGPDVALGPLGRLGLVIGQFKPTAQMIAETVPPPAATDEESRYGRYLALTICAQCHGTSLRGASNPEFKSPDLLVVAAYSPEAFVQLLKTGVAIGGRNAGVMSASARDNLSSLTDTEIAALYSYLHSLPEDPHN